MKTRGLQSSIARADLLFEQHRQEIFRNTDQLFAKLMVAQWVAGIVAAFLIAPRTWAGQASQIHIHVWGAIFIGAIISAFPIWMIRIWPGAAVTRYVVAVAQMLMSGLLIDLTGGRIETHFHVFGSLVILSFYRDWRVLIPATIVVGLDHFVRGVYWPYSVYGVLTASPWRSIEHAGWVVFEDVFLVISCLRSIEEMRSIANRTAALEANEQNFRQIFEDAPIGMAVVGLDERFIRVNATLCQMVGYSEDELIDRTPLDITHRDDVERSKELAQAILNGTDRCRVEKRYLHKRGAVLWATRTACMIRDEAGKPEHFLIMVEDISERKRTETALGQSKRQLESALHAKQLIMDHSQDVICTVDEAGRFITVNAACEQLWGYRPDELVGRQYIDLVHPEDRPKTAKAEADLKVAGKVADFVNRYVRKDGALVDVLWSATWSERNKTFFGVAHDITERLRIERALREAKAEADRANQAKSEFLSRMSHELRTPLNVILGFGQLLEKQNPTNTQKIRLAHINTAGRHLLRLINEVLDISRIEAEKLQLSLEPVCLADVLEEAIGLMRPLATEREINFLIPQVLDRRCYVLTDRQRFNQVMLNLLTNAIKYSPLKGKVTVSYGASKSGTIRIRVNDNGPGIPKQKLSRLFTPFDRLGAEQSTIEGTGLGLALSQRLMKAMQGSIGVNSTVGEGSTFWVELPRAASPLERVLSEKRNESEPEEFSSTAKRKILYVEDNLSNVTLIEHMLREQPETQLITAMQGQLALDLARKHSPDVILLDLHLPDLPGWDVLSQLQHEEATRHIPVVIISADATPGEIKRLMAAGAHAYLTKPIQIPEFFEIIEKATKQRNGATQCAVAQTGDRAAVEIEATRAR